ncbi:MAG: glycosyltransferase [Methanomicrobiales archaeon]
MKALFIVTGRGEGGDAVTALNISKALKVYNISSEFALDPSASGLLFKKKGIDWHKTPIPQAGGHAATKLSLAKGGFKTLKAAYKSVKLIKKIRPDVVIGIIGGGAVIACIASKIARIPAVGVSNTPTDAKVCSNLTTTIALPESSLFKQESVKDNVKKTYYPLDPKILNGNIDRARKLMPSTFKEDIPTILLSSGSILFEKMALAAFRLSESPIEANIVVAGTIRNEKCKELLKSDNIIYLGYVDWMNDLLKLADLAVLSDDGMMINEALACNLPIVSLVGVKYGRYHNIASIFEGAVIESDINQISNLISDLLDNINDYKAKASEYGEEVLKSSDKIAKIIKEQIKN